VGRNRDSSEDELFQAGLNAADAGSFQEAIELYWQSIDIRPGRANVLFALGNALHASGQPDEAADAYRRAIAARPDFAEAFNNLGVILSAAQPAEAIEAFRTAVTLRPDYADAHNNYGVALSAAGDTERAVAAWRRALAAQPAFAPAWVNLGAAFQDVALLNDAIRCYRNALAIDPASPAAHNLLYALHFHPDCGLREIRDEHDRWNRRHVRPLAHLIRPHLNDPSPDRPLKIGYVSPDFRGHPIGRFMLPILANHDHRHFHVHCYSDVVCGGE